MFDKHTRVVIIFHGSETKNIIGRGLFTEEKVMLKRFAFVAALTLAAAGAFAGQVVTGSKDHELKLPFCGT